MLHIWYLDWWRGFSYQASFWLSHTLYARVSYVQSAIHVLHKCYQDSLLAPCFCFFRARFQQDESWEPTERVHDYGPRTHLYQRTFSRGVSSLEGQGMCQQHTPGNWPIQERSFRICQAHFSLPSRMYCHKENMAAFCFSITRKFLRPLAFCKYSQQGWENVLLQCRSTHQHASEESKLRKLNRWKG